MKIRILNRLLFVLVLGTILTVHAGTNMLLAQAPVTTSGASLQIPSDTAYSYSIRDTSPPSARDTAISSVQYGYIQDVCWSKANDFQRQIYSIMRSRHGGSSLLLLSAGSGSGRMALHHSHNAIISDASSLFSLTSFSPPGLVLRL